MLCPEVWRFSPPKSVFTVRGDCSETHLHQELSKRDFYHSIFVLCADTTREIPTGVQELIDEYSPYYKLSDCSLDELLRPEFIDGFVKKGNLSCLSSEPFSRSKTSVSIAQGNLSLILNKQDYQELGLEGQYFRRENFDPFYYIKINLTSSQFITEKKNYENIKKKIRTLNNFTFIIRWEPDESNICPSSIANYLAQRNLKVEVCNPKLNLMRQYASHIPAPSIDTAQDVMEWMGMIAIGGDLCPQNEYLSSYSINEELVTAGHITGYQISGLFTPQIIKKLREVMRKTIKNNECRWVGMTAQSFTDTPEKFEQLCSKKSYTDNLLTFIIANNMELLLKCF